MQEDEVQSLPLVPPDQQIELLGSPNRAVAYQAAVALTQQGSAILDAAVQGLLHANPKVRRACADLMDHLGDDRCIEPLIEATTDTIPNVRRQAIHSLSCQRCKAVPLHVDLVTLLIERATTDPSIKVRQEAVFGLSMQPTDRRAIGVLEQIIADARQKKVQTKAERVLYRNARFALKRQLTDAQRVTPCPTD
ncbi:MAG: HEAT repeat domain-containing protein [Roseiflexaceae bacterium]|nr:HEAT repeat domain-containing protein [Roseiflexaceae bacterium]